MLPLYIDETTIIRINEVRDPTYGQYVNNATITFTIRDAAGAVLAGAENISMPYIAGTDGRYEGELAHTCDLGTPGTEYDLEVTIVGSRRGFRKIRCVAMYHGVR